MDVTSPCSGAIIGTVGLSDASDVEIAISHAKAAFESWSSITVKERAKIMFRFQQV